MLGLWRRRVLLIIVLGVFAVPLVFTGWLLWDRQPEPSPRASHDCIPQEPSRTVADINDFIRSDAMSPAFVGGDVGASVGLSDGRTLFAFGDTLRPPEEPGPTLVRNSLLISGQGCLSVYIPPDGGAAVPNRSDGVGYWPMSVDLLPTDEGVDRVGVSMMRVRATGEGPWDFEIIGSSLATFDVPLGGMPVPTGVVDIGPDAADNTAPLWGAALTLTGKWAYIYGTAHPGDEYVFGYSLHVARAPIANRAFVDPLSWRYWDGQDWVLDRGAAVDVVPAQDGVSRVLSVFRQGDSWYALSKRNDFLGREMVIWSADSPTGPFVPGPPVATIPSDEHELQYMPLAHPDLLPRRGTMVVSWSNNAADPLTLREDPRLYRPTFRRVDLP